MDFSKLKPKASHFKVVINGKSYRLTMRPFTLRDQAWMQEHFDLNDLALRLMSLHLDTVARVVWYQLNAASKSIFDKFNMVDENGVPIEEHQQLLASMECQEDLVKALTAFNESRGLNAPQVKKVLNEMSVKKKP